MRILILENDKERIKIFKKYCDNYDVTYVDKVDRANSLLATIKYDLIFLDHDLGDIIYENPHNEGTGYQVAKNIPNTINKETKVIIHSLNYYGAMLMRQAIGNHAIYMPFTILIDRFKNIFRK